MPRFCVPRFALLVLVLGWLPACVTNPATGKKEFVPFMPSKEQQLKLGLDAAPKFESQAGGRYPDAAIQSYVNQVGQRIASTVPPDQATGCKFTYTVLSDQAVNAFALPGGPIYITQGLLFRLRNEAELAFVLGHETGHIVAQHVGRQMSKATELQLLLTGAGVAAGQDPGTAAQVGLALGKFASQMYLLQYSRAEELEADTLGLRYLVAARYDPRAAIGVMQVLEKASGGGKGPDWFSTHPSAPNRITDLESQIARRYATAVNNPAYITNAAHFEQSVLRRRTPR